MNGKKDEHPKKQRINVYYNATQVFYHKNKLRMVKIMKLKYVTKILGQIFDILKQKFST